MGPMDGPLRGMEAVQALQRFLLDDTLLVPPPLADAPMVRLVATVAAFRAGSAALPSPLDLAVLVRHYLRWCVEAQKMAGITADLLVPRAHGWPDRTDWERVGVRADDRPGAFRVTAHPWIPDWLPDVPPSGVDGRAVGAPLRRLNHPVPADPFLAQDFPDRQTYRSAGQRTALRACLQTPPGATLLVGLPTGDGKSLIFQALARRGFPRQEDRGLVVVVTPTVALALDHEATAVTMNLAEEPLAYQGGDANGGNQQIVERVKAGTQGILFTSPEAICRGPLGPALAEAAGKGLLSALVVDEAHLIETWGKEFRPDFQVLAGIRMNLLRACPAAPFRTILLSATITEQTVETVRTLFGKGRGGEEAFALYSAMYLRPEIEYWVQRPLDPEVRDEYVREALYHLPRPAILYVTTIVDAETWAENCKTLGYRRVAMLTGATSSYDRKEIVRAWKAGELDLVVGNAAFGLGIDKSDVRAVIHACVPESLDRFYQEVGRGGRDGRASVSLLLPTLTDVRIARSMQAKHISLKKGYQRWEAMFLGRLPYDNENHTHQVWVDTAPGGGADRLDYSGKSNTHWNLNTLTLMASAGLIEMEALISLPVDPQGSVITDPEAKAADYREYQRLRLPEGPFLDEGEWGKRVEPFRKASFRAQMKSVNAMVSLWQDDTCLADQFAPIYTLSGYGVHVAKQCGGCPACRRRGKPRSVDAVHESPPPWPPSPITGVGAQMVDEQNLLLIHYETADLPTSERKWERIYKPIAALLRRSGIHNVIIPPGALFRADLLQRHCGAWPIFVADSLRLPMRPSGPTLMFVPEGTEVTLPLLEKRTTIDARILVVHEAVADPSTPGARLIDRHHGRTLSFDLFKRQVEQ